jgi:hypothetical protein
LVVLFLIPVKQVAEGVDRLLTAIVPVKPLDGVSMHPSIISASSQRQLYVKGDLRWYARLLDYVRCHVPLRLCRFPHAVRRHEERARRLRGIAHLRPIGPKCPKRWPHA